MDRADRSERMARLRRLEGVTIADGRYHIERLAALGGSGGVFRARQIGLERPVAVKVVALEPPLRRARFLREIAALSTVAHPNLVVLHDQGTLDDRHAFLVMEWLDGCSLARFLAGHGPLAPHVAIRVLRQVVAALGALHARGMVHRDVKPGNVMVLGARPAAELSVKLVDLGTVRLRDEDDPAPACRTRTGGIVGTRGYLAPEQALGGPCDARADIWAAGTLLRAMSCGASGAVPVRGEADAALPPVLRNVVRLATSDDRERRPATTAALLHLLEAAERELLRDPPSADGGAPTIAMHALRAALSTCSVRRARAEAPTLRLSPDSPPVPGFACDPGPSAASASPNRSST